MDALQALLATSLEIERDVFIKRLGVNFRIKAIDTATLDKAREQATHISGKGNKRESVVDAQKLNAILTVKFCVTPDFTNKALLEKYGAANGVECVTKALLPGELVRIISAGMELSGFNDDEDEEEEIKN